jgi:hypothetical protein
MARGWRRVRGSRHTGRAVERPFGEKWRACPLRAHVVGLPGLKALAAAAKEPKPFRPGGQTSSEDLLLIGICMLTLRGQCRWKWESAPSATMSDERCRPARSKPHCKNSTTALPDDPSSASSRWDRRRNRSSKPATGRPSDKQCSAAWLVEWKHRRRKLSRPRG